VNISFAILSLISFLLLNVYSTTTYWESTSIGLFVYFFLDFLNGLGKKIVIYDLSIVMAFFTWLVMPVIFFHEYTIQNPLAKLWNVYMPISSDEYFSFALPASVMLMLGFKFPLGKNRVLKEPRLYLENLRQSLKGRSNVGFLLMTIGVVSSLIQMIVGQNHLLYLADHLIFVGVFYIMFSDFKNKRTILLLVLCIVVGSSILTGMFGEFVFLLVLALILLSLEWKKVTFPRKLVITFAGIFLIVVIQTIKRDYRAKAWRGGGDPLYFGELILKTVSSPADLLDDDKLFASAVRMNQGWLVARTMKEVPARYPYAYGETIGISVIAGLVPRFFWPDKPEVGGKYNLKRFWGYEIKGYSMNIGPIGEAYANFGRTGGIIFMFFYGLFFNMILVLVLKRTEKHPTLLCWIPYLFLYAVGVETDILTTFSSIITATIFMLMTMWIFKYVFRVAL
jgi:hypothetical protein